MRVPCTYAPRFPGELTTTKRRTLMFSPIFATSDRRRSSMLSPLSSFRASSAASEAGLAASVRAATLRAKARKSCSRATKSVSQLTSTMAAARASGAFSMTITPSAATREAFLSAFASPCLRISSAAASRSPLVSTSAFLHSIMPAPVRSRSCLTDSAVMFIPFAPTSLCRTAAAGPLAAATPTPTRRPPGGASRGTCSGTTGGHHLAHLLDLQILIIGHVHSLRSRDHRHLDGRGAPAGRGLLAHRCLRPLPGAGGFLARIARFIQLDELILASGHRGHRLLALEYRVRDPRGVELDGAHGVVVARDDVVDAIGRAIGVDDGDHGNAELPGLVDRDLLVAHVDHEHGIRERVHVLDPAEAPLELFHLAAQLGRLFLATLLQSPGGSQLSDLPEPLDGLADGLEVREHAAQPALVHERLAGPLGLLLDRLTRGALGADEEDRAPVGDHALDEVRGLRIERLRLLQIDDVDLVAFAEDERGHLRVPEAGLMSKMDPRLQHLSHGHAGHGKSPVRVGPPRIPAGHPTGPEPGGTPSRSGVRYAC